MYGPEAFSYTLLQEVSAEEADAAEIKGIADYNTFLRSFDASASKGHVVVLVVKAWTDKA